MVVNFKVIYEKVVLKKDIPKLDLQAKIRIKQEIENKLMVNPVLFGTPLRNTLKGYFKLRVGDYRIVFTISESVVLVIMIMHRKNIYESLVRRLDR